MTAKNDSFDLLYPLNRFYESEHLSLPRVKRVPGEKVPEPYRGLLVHDRDMTPTLEAFYNEPMGLHVIHSGIKDGTYCREVVLYGEQSNKPTEYGSIKISLELFDAKSRAEILEGHLPLGTILARNAVKHASAPRAFFEIESDAITQAHFKLSAPRTLYGRRNRLTFPDGQTLAEIVEILPPAS